MWQLVKLDKDEFPQKDKKRALRRSQKERKYKQARKQADRVYITAHLFAKDQKEWNKIKEEYARKHADNLKACSCPMCGNFRKYHGITIREAIENEKFEYTKHYGDIA